MKLADKIASYSSTPRSGKRTKVAKILPIFVFFFFFPTLLFWVPHTLLDKWLNLPAIPNPPVRRVVGGLMIITGVTFLLMTLKAQRDIGKGTPMPLMATQKLVVQKPYAWTRNPLAFGLLNLYFGISIFMGSLASLLVVLVFTTVILSYIKFVEEKELAQRYGAPYEDYKQHTPFLFPRPSKQR